MGLTWGWGSLWVGEEQRALLVLKSPSFHLIVFIVKGSENRVRSPFPFPPQSTEETNLLTFPKLLSFTLFTVRAILAKSFPESCSS